MPITVIQMVLKFILSFCTFLSVLTCSNIANFDEESLAKLKLIRQTNSPESQRLLRELSRLGRSGKGFSEESLDHAWTAYEDGYKEFLLNYIRKGGFDPNQLIRGERSLLVGAILHGDLELVDAVLKLPGIDVNYMGNSGLLPIELALVHPNIFNLLLTTGVDLMARNLFGMTPIGQALREGKLDMAERMLREVRIEWERKSIQEKEEIIKLENELRAKLRYLRMEKVGKVKID